MSEARNPETKRGTATDQHDAPPSYAQATGSSTNSYLNVPVAQSHHGIPNAARRSMEDEQRPLPAGWIRQFDSRENHQFFVDTKANPPRSIWHHPYDDDEFLKTLPAEERERIQEEEEKIKRPFTPTTPGVDIKHDPEKKPDTNPFLPPRTTSNAPVRPPAQTTASSMSQASTKQKKGMGEKLKEKMTGMTSEQRSQMREQQRQQEQEYYMVHQKFRQALQQAQMTGQPAFMMKDKDGKDIYVEPPQMMQQPNVYGGGFSQYGGGGYGGHPQGQYGGNGYGVNPYQSGVYSNPNNKFIRPQQQYRRGGGGMALPIMGGVLGGMLLGDLMF